MFIDSQAKIFLSELPWFFGRAASLKVGVGAFWGSSFTQIQALPTLTE
jgi:hypothetical protein